MTDPNESSRWPHTPRIEYPPKISTLAKEFATIIGLSLFGVVMVLAVLWLTVGEG